MFPQGYHSPYSNRAMYWTFAVHFPARAKCFLLTETFRTCLGSTLPPIQGIIRAPLTFIKRPKREADDTSSLVLELQFHPPPFLTYTWSSLLYIYFYLPGFIPCL